MEDSRYPNRQKELTENGQRRTATCMALHRPESNFRETVTTYSDGKTKISGSKWWKLCFLLTREELGLEAFKDFAFQPKAGGLSEQEFHAQTVSFEAKYCPRPTCGSLKMS
ncbi:hypothetical protein HAX54_044040 [Datura stramonium]|uniref:Uncharacterized protein n=1 Tax=Datura stramonium TaxID=4076 RepID=A0ABS8SNY3_DATST|nr:hypothetical protein [Datura stramonium]